MNGTGDADTPSELAKFVLNLVSELYVEFPEFAHHPERARGISLTRALRQNANIEEALHNILSKDDSFGFLRRGWMSFAGSGHECGSHVLPLILIRNAIEGRPIDKTIDLAKAFARTRTTDGYWFAAICGVEVSQTLPLTDGVDLIPWDLVPDCAQRVRLDQTESDSFFGAFRPKPNCALRIYLPARRVLFSTAMEADSYRSLEELTLAYSKADDLVRAMTLVSDEPVAMIGAWPHPNEEIFREIYATNFGYGSALTDKALFGPSRNPFRLNGEGVRQIFCQFDKFRGGDVSAVKTAIDRIASARRGENLVNKVIDLGIALEVLLLHNVESSSELKYRLALRGANLLGGNRQTKINTFSQLKKGYDLRSKAVHRGLVEGDERNRQTVDAMSGLATSIARKIVGQGRFPDWEKELILSDDASTGDGKTTLIE